MLVREITTWTHRDRVNVYICVRMIAVRFDRAVSWFASINYVYTNPYSVDLLLCCMSSRYLVRACVCLSGLLS